MDKNILNYYATLKEIQQVNLLSSALQHCQKRGAEHVTARGILAQLKLETQKYKNTVEHRIKREKDINYIDLINKSFSEKKGKQGKLQQLIETKYFPLYEKMEKEGKHISYSNLAKLIGKQERIIDVFILSLSLFFFLIIEYCF